MVILGVQNDKINSGLIIALNWRFSHSELALEWRSDSTHFVYYQWDKRTPNNAEQLIADNFPSQSANTNRNLKFAAAISGIEHMHEWYFAVKANRLDYKNPEAFSSENGSAQDTICLQVNY